MAGSRRKTGCHAVFLCVLQSLYVRSKTSLRLDENVKEFGIKRKCVLLETQGRFGTVFKSL